MTEIERHYGIAREDFGLSIRGQLVHFANGSRIIAVDQATRDAIEASAAQVDWDDDEDEMESEAGAPALPRRRGRPPKAV